MEQSPVKNQGVSQSHTRDPITLKLHTDKEEISIAEELTLVLETSVPENTEVEFPSYSASLGDFTLKDTRIHPPRLTGSDRNVRVLQRATYFLEPYLSGRYTIPAMTVTFRQKSDNGEVIQLMTEKIDVAVISLLPSGVDEAEIKDIKPPLPLPANRTQQLLLTGLVLLLAVLALFGFFYWKRLKSDKTAAAVQVRPEEIALRDLEKLLAEDLLARGQIKLFHLRISDILRHYIENRFGLKAPDRTTEEFLTELSYSDTSEQALLGNHKNLLKDFLTQCDLVKFAKHEPTVAESEKTVLICRDFIEKTREDRFQGLEVSRGQGDEKK